MQTSLFAQTPDGRHVGRGRAPARHRPVAPILRASVRAVPSRTLHARTFLTLRPRGQLLARDRHGLTLSRHRAATRSRACVHHCAVATPLRVMLSVSACNQSGRLDGSFVALTTSLQIGKLISSARHSRCSSAAARAWEWCRWTETDFVHWFRMRTRSMPASGSW